MQVLLCAGSCLDGWTSRQHDQLPGITQQISSQASVVIDYERLWVLDIVMLASAVIAGNMQVLGFSALWGLAQPCCLRATRMPHEHST